MLVEPEADIVEQRQGPFLPDPLPFLGGQGFGLSLDPIQLLDLCHGHAGKRGLALLRPKQALRLDGLVELAPDVRPTAECRQAVLGTDLAVSFIAIGQQIAFEALEQADRYLLTSRWIVVVEQDRVIRRPAALNP